MSVPKEVHVVPADAAPPFDAVIALIGEVKPSISPGTITPDHCLVDDLGLDSLDMLQLTRKIVRRVSPAFDREAWEEAQPTHRRTVASLVAHLDTRVVE